LYKPWSICFLFQKYYFFSYDAKLQTSHSNILRTVG